MSAAHKGKKWEPNDSRRAKLSAAHKGKSLSEETRAKISARLMGRKMPEETKAKISNSMKKGRLRIQQEGI